MAIKTLQSNQVTFVDTTDSRKLEVYLASNLPTVQIYNVNTGVYSPDWSVGEKLKLTASIFLDSKGISPTTIRWYKQIGTAVKTQLTTTGAYLTISTNEMTGDASAIIIYSCEVEYQGLKASSQITFTRTDTGRDGKNGEDARVIALYSEDEVTWTDLTETPNPKYIKFSYDNGVHWATPIRIAGEDGSSIVIKGTATSRSLVADTDYYTLVYAGTTISNAELGDSYLFSGDLYVCASKQEGVDHFINVGKVQGPQGAPGESSYLFVRYAKDENGNGITNTPTSETKWIATYVSPTDTFTDEIEDKLVWRKFVGEDGKDAKAIVLSGSSQIFKVNNGVPTPDEIKITAQAINTNVDAWNYSTDGGITFEVDKPSDKIYISDNVMTIPSSALTKDSLVIKAIDETGEYSDTFTVYKVSDGVQGETGIPASMAFLTNENVSFSANSNGKIKDTKFETSVVAYTGTNKVLPQIGDPIGVPSDVIVEITTKDSEKVISFSIPDNSNLGADTNTNGTITIPITSPVETELKLNWSKINTGADGVGIDSIQVKYGTTSSVTVKPADDQWSDAIPTVLDGHYLWTRTITDYTDPSKDSTVVYTYAKQGQKGDAGVDGTSVMVSSIEYQEGTSATAAPTDKWSRFVVPVAEGNYLWTKTTLVDDEGDKVVFGVAKQGNTGRGISKITEHYLASTASTGVTTATTGWTTTVQTIDSSKRYLWNYEVVTYTDGTTSSTTPIIIGVFGSTGATGKGIKSVTEYYLASASSSGVVTSTGEWTTTMQTLTATNKYLWNYELITYTDNTTSTIAPVIIGVYGDKGDKGDTGNAGRGISSIVEQYYHSTSATSQTGGSWVTTAPTWVDGKYIWTRSVITYTDTTTYTTSPICVTGHKGGTGGTGVGVSSVDVWYYHSTSATALSGGSWATTAPTWSDGKYVWTKTITTYTNGTTDETVAVCVTGQKGSTGVGIKSVTEYYLATASSSGVTISTTGWTTAIQTITSDKKYLWNYEVITYTDNTTSTTNPIIIGVFGNPGVSGKGIKSITEYYLATASASGVATTTTGWTTTMQTLTTTNKYLWNYELITYTDDSTATINPVIIGVYGDRGAPGAAGTDAYTVLLTNESHVFAGTTSSAVASRATTQILAYKGTTAQTVTIVSVNGVAAATASTATGIAGLTFACSALSGISPTITFTCTTAFVSSNGTIPIVLSVGGVSITKMFTYSIAFKGATGGQGNPGNPGSPATAYWLVSSAGVVQKTSVGTVALTPSTLTFTGKSKTGTSAPTDYGCRWIIAYSTDGINYTNAYTSSADETSKVFTVDATYKSVRARMYLAGGTTTLLDEQIIPVVTDGATGAPGDAAVTFQVYSSNGYALSVNTPIITLQTFAYIGDVEITSGAEYQWYSYDDGWNVISGATLSYIDISRDSVSLNRSYMCKMTFGDVEYTDVATIDDKSDENKVFTTKPISYSAGDLWIVGADYAPVGIEVGTLLKAEHTSSVYADSDWTLATKYDDRIEEIKNEVGMYNQYFSFTSDNGVKISARDANGVESQFSTSLTNKQLSFNYGDEAIAYIDGTKMNIKEAEIESPLTVTGKYSGSTMLQAPIINIGNFSIVVESNNSLSIIANT